MPHLARQPIVSGLVFATACGKLSPRVRSQNPGSFVAQPGSNVDSVGSFVALVGSFAGFSGEM